MKLEHKNEIKGIIVLGFSLLLLASLISYSPFDLPWYTSAVNVPIHNLIGIVGAYVAGMLYFVLGYGAFALTVFGFFVSWNKFTSRDIQCSVAKFLSLVVLLIVASSLLAMIFAANAQDQFRAAGLLGIMFSDFLQKYLSPLGAVITLSVLGSLALVVTGEFMVSPFVIWCVGFFRKSWEAILSRFRNISLFKASLPRVKEPVVKKEVKFAEKDFVALSKTMPLPAAAIPVNKPTTTSNPHIHIVAPKETGQVPTEHVPKVIGEYRLPSLDLLNDMPVVPEGKIQETLMQGAKILEETLADFGVNVKVVDIERGPVITRYELQPAPGVKIQSIASLSDDIALALSAPAVRILAPIPGKNRVGIEVPNGLTASVFLKDVLAQGKAQSSASKLTLCIGKDTSGKPLFADLAEMPHLLVAGTTGSGKTVCLNALIMSVLFNAAPDEVKFIMVDPKMVELVPYNDLPHLITPVITDAKKVTPVLNWLVGEMENRYKTLAKEQVRNIKGYHAKGLKMPYIMVVVDELADLMQVSAKSVEASIARLSQLARAVGIHLILATQRPSVDVITGVIKANFPARLSFKVASKVDSRTVLDANGAENLLGKGDLLFMKPGDPKPTRGQCCYLSDEEINKVIAFIKTQGSPSYDEHVIKAPTHASGGQLDEKDEMYDEAVKVIIETNQASVTILQRRLRLGYSRAARLIDMMEQNGIVGPYAGSKARDILVDREKWLIENAGNVENNDPVNK